MENKKYWLILLAVFSFLLYFSRWAFVEKLNLDYLEEFYLDSQWKNPRSKRIMSDNELYQYAGYKYLKGEDLFLINPEVPPLGKYIYGVSIIVFNNPYYASLTLFVLAFVAYYFLITKLVKNEQHQFIAFLLYLLSPLVFQQITRSMLDLPLLLFFLLHINFIIRIGEKKSQNKNILLTVLAGISLGFFAASKFPVYVPFILLADLIYLFKEKKLIYSIPIMFVTAIMYTLMFLPYFLKGNSFYSWIKAELWTIDFYSGGRAKEHVLSKILGLFTGFVLYIHSNRGIERIETWSITWPAAIITGIFFMKKNFLKNKSNQLFYIQFLFVELLLFLLIFDFAPRYFLAILVLGITFIVIEVPRKLLRALISIVCIQAVIFVRSGPSSDLKFIIERWEGQYYKDLYFFTNRDYRNSIDFRSFNRKLQESMDYKPSVNIAVDPSTIFDNRVSGKIEIRNSENMELKFVGDINFIREHNKWKLVWDDKFIHYE
jgi:predicted membrane-bound dolichyl-phosphate-mannose-protein mannosyltransferase